VYRCLPCGMTNICLACARSCHGGHAVEVLFKGRSSVTSTPATAAATAASATASTIATATAAGPACGCSAVPATCECRWTPVAGNTLSYIFIATYGSRASYYTDTQLQRTAAALRHSLILTSRHVALRLLLRTH
jgi:hypothetical protein